MSPPHASLAFPDPVRAHGAWIYLFTSLAAGALVGAKRGVEPAMLVGTAFTGAYLLTAAWIVGRRRKGRQILVGLVSLAGALPLAVWLGAGRASLLVGAAATVPAGLAVWLARTRGFLSWSSLFAGIAALVAVAPAAALAGGAGPSRSALLFASLWPFYCWRSLRLALPLEAGGEWDPAELRARGLREAAVAAVWTLLVAMVLRP